jgi:hypothetical protein
VTAPAVTVVSFARSHWRWFAGAALAVLILLGGWCYGSNQYARGRDLARADIADSIGKVYEAKFHVMADSVTREMAAFKASVAAADARAADADARAASASARANAVLTPQVIARTPPEVLALIQDLRSAVDTDRVAIADLRVHLDTALARESQYSSALVLADSALAQKDRTIAALRIVKEPPHGFWHTVGMVAKYTAAGATGVVLGAVLIH